MHFRLNISKTRKQSLRKKMKDAEKTGNLPLVKRSMAILAISEDQTISEVAKLLCASQEAIRHWLKRFLVSGLRGLVSKRPPGRPPKLTKSQRKELARLIDAGPSAAGLIGHCWRSPMIQHLIMEHFDIYYSVNYISQLLKNMGFTYQKACFVSDHLDRQTRAHWLQHTWPDILALAKKRGLLAVWRRGIFSSVGNAKLHLGQKR